MIYNCDRNEHSASQSLLVLLQALSSTAANIVASILA